MTKSGLPTSLSKYEESFIFGSDYIEGEPGLRMVINDP